MGSTCLFPGLYLIEPNSFPAWILWTFCLRSLAKTVYPPFTSLGSSQSFFRAFCDKLASSLLLAYHIKMQHPLLILSRLFFAVMAERHWRSHL